MNTEPTGGVNDVVRRRLATVARDPMSWVWTALVVFIAAVLRLFKLSHPDQIIFDETYYATEAKELLDHGVEWRPEENNGDFVVHPPLGKWLIALGEWLFRYDSFGWRISAAVAGILTVLLITRIARRMFRSTVLGCAAGLLMSLDGLHFVLSRAALLDIFLTLFVLAAFGCLVLDRDQRRARWLASLEAGQRPALGIPWWRLAAGVSIGCAAAVKQSGLFFLPALVLLLLLWEVGLRRTVGNRKPWSAALRNAGPAVLAMVALGLATYLATWTGWFLSDDGWNRHGLRNSGRSEPPFIGALINLWDYHVQGYQFHEGLHLRHGYQSWPWQWLLMGRPVAFYWDQNQPCGAEKCAAEILLLGTPLLWWSFIAALAGLAWFGIARRDMRAGSIGIMVASGMLPWFWYHYSSGRTMFVFYVLPVEPFLILAAVYVLGAIMGPAASPAASPAALTLVPDRRLIGAVVGGVYVIVIALCFAYFYPIYTGMSISYDDWWARMWLSTRWV